MRRRRGPPRNPEAPLLNAQVPEHLEKHIIRHLIKAHVCLGCETGDLGPLAGDGRHGK